MQVRNTVILGTGCSGLTAAIYAARANLRTIVLQGEGDGVARAIRADTQARFFTGSTAGMLSVLSSGAP